MFFYTSRERLRTALDHREPDRVPLDLAGTVVTGITARAYQNYVKFKNLDLPEPPIADLKQGLVEPHPTVLDALGADTRSIGPEPGADYRFEMHREGDYEFFYDEFGIGWRRPVPDGLYFDMFHHPLAACDSAAETKQYRWPDPADPARYTTLEQQVAAVKPLGKALILGRMMAGVFEMALWLRGFSNFFTDMAADPSYAGWLLDKLCDMKMQFWQCALAEAGPDIDVLMEADDLASQHALLISRQMYRDLILPRHRRLFGFIKTLAPHAKVFFHSCGAVYPLIPDLIEAGIEILNPVQVSAQGMDRQRLKKEFGDALSFWGGGVDTQHILPYGSPDEVRDDVKRAIDAFAPGGGFVFNTVHNIQADVPPENIEAMYSTLAEYGVYAAPARV